MDRRFGYSVEPGDILTYEADLVVFKYAQRFYGADHAAATALVEAGAVPRDALSVGVGDFRFVETRGALRAPLALFIGTPPIAQFGYAAVRDFGARAAELAVRQAPGVRRLAMTVHGVGFGLDELGAFLAELQGVGDSLAQLQAPELESVTFVEREPGRVERLARALTQLTPGGVQPSPHGAHGGWELAVGTSPGDDLVPAPLPPELRSTPEDKPSVFVAMPFTPRGDELFAYPIQNAAHACGFICERVDKTAYTGDVLARIKQRIAGAALVIAELSGQNANVHLEVGYAWGCGRETVLLLADGEDPAFDVAGQNQIRYGSLVELEERLTAELRALPVVDRHRAPS
jgi:hypothetical protein